MVGWLVDRQVGRQAMMHRKLMITQHMTSSAQIYTAIERLQRSVIGSLSEDQRPGVEAMVVSKFYEWLSASGNLRQVGR